MRFPFGPLGVIFLAAGLLTGCAGPSGRPAAAIPSPAIAAAYRPLTKSFALGLEAAAGASMTVASGVAVTNAHNRNLVDPALILAQDRDYDLLFFRAGVSVPPPPVSAPATGLSVTAYGADLSGHLRQAEGVIRRIVTCAGCGAPAYFVFANPVRGASDAGPGFSGGPVVDAKGRLVGITFGFKDEAGQRLIYAYDMARVMAEFSRLLPASAGGQNQ